MKKNVKLSSNTGDRLKEVREDLGLDIREVSEAIHVQARYIEQIEEGDYNNLPADVYVRGFLKKYAEYLKLPVDEIVNFYQKEKQITSSIEDAENVNKIGVKQKLVDRIFITPKLISLFIFSVIVVGVMGYFIYEIGFLISPPALVIESPAEDIEVMDAKINIKGRVDYDTFVKINDQSIVVGDDGIFNQEIVLTPGLNILNIKATNRLDKESSVVRRIVFSPLVERVIPEELDEPVGEDRP